jgi:putative endopeptidase
MGSSKQTSKRTIQPFRPEDPRGFDTILGQQRRSVKRPLTVVIVIVVSLLAACTAKPQAKARPEFGVWGFDAAGQDKSRNPGDGFFRYANGSWLDRTLIPHDKVSFWMDTPADDLIEANLRDLLEQGAAHAGHEPSDLQGKAGAYYASFMDKARSEQRGATPIEPELIAIRGAHSADEMAALTGRSVLDFDSTYFKVWQNIDQGDPRHYAVYLGQDGLGLPDRDYFLKPDFAELKAKYQTYIGHMLELINWPDADANARHVVEFETAVADASWTKEQQRDPVANYHAMSLDELERLAPGFAWRKFLAEARLPQVSRVVVAEKDAFPKLAVIWQRTPLDVLKAWEAFHVADAAGPYLSNNFADAYFEFRGKTLGGQQEQKDRWKRAVLAVAGGDFLNADRFGRSGTMGFGVGQLYANKYFGADAKMKIESLVVNLKAAFRARIEHHLDWMKPSTKTEALKKLDAYIVKVGFPDHPRDYSSLRILDDDLAGNVRRAEEFDWAFYSARLSGPVDRTDWFGTPQTNNTYNTDLIDIVFPAGALHAPAFDPNADPAVNYGGIGGLIGHELIHGFDDAGRKVDNSGALRDWWTKTDALQFETRAKRLGEQYSSYEALPALHVNGKLTMGENIADLGGLTIALDAYHASLDGKPAPVLDGFTGDQRVFLGWAQSWRNKRTDEALRKMVASNPHAPSQFRVDGIVRNMDSWYDAFGVKPGDKLYLPPETRVRIW